MSVFYCYGDNKLKAIFYEVKNTFNEQHTYLFKVTGTDEITQKCKKKFYVSPFMDMETFYNFKLIDPQEKLSVFNSNPNRCSKRIQLEAANNKYL